jgi:ribulose-5-phosphate 4-epimerase/fuculose-1-phosphate aldolase
MKTSKDSERVSELKSRLAESVRICVREELLENFGHVSARDPQSKRIFVLRHLHERLDKVTAKDVIEVDAMGRAVGGKLEPPKEVFLHTAIYRKRKDVHAVVYSHPLYRPFLVCSENRSCRCSPIARLSSQAFGFLRCHGSSGPPKWQRS